MGGPVGMGCLLGGVCVCVFSCRVTIMTAVTVTVTGYRYG